METKNIDQKKAEETVIITFPKNDIKELNNLFSPSVCCEKQVETAIKTELFNLFS